MMGWVLRETKTATRPDSSYFLRLPLDWQLLGYCNAVKETLGISLDRVEYDVVVKPSIRLKTKETTTAFAERVFQQYVAKPQEMFIRHPVMIPSGRVDLWRKQASYVARELIKARDRGKGFWQNVTHCMNKWGACAFLQACADGEAREVLYKERGWTPPKDKKLRLSHTQLSTWMQCPKLYWWKYIKGMEPAVTPAYFLVGRGVHVAIERIQQGLPWEQALEQEFSEIDTQRLDADTIHKLEVEKAKSHGMARGYEQQYSGESEGWSKQLTEQEFTIPLIPEADYYGKVDLIYKEA